VTRARDRETTEFATEMQVGMRNLPRAWEGDCTRERITFVGALVLRSMEWCEEYYVLIELE
jgi:hypothetical protein